VAAVGVITAALLLRPRPAKHAFRTLPMAGPRFVGLAAELRF
jgi:hypothetical protein